MNGGLDLAAEVACGVPSASLDHMAIVFNEASRPIQHVGMRVGSDEHPSVWRSAIVALGLMGVAPNGTDVQAAAAAESHDQSAVALGAILADADGAGAILAALERNAVGSGPSAMALARRRLALGRLIAVVG